MELWNLKNAVRIYVNGGKGIEMSGSQGVDGPSLGSGSQKGQQILFKVTRPNLVSIHLSVKRVSATIFASDKTFGV